MYLRASKNKLIDGNSEIKDILLYYFVPIGTDLCAICQVAKIYTGLPCLDYEGIQDLLSHEYHYPLLD